MKSYTDNCCTTCVRISVLNQFDGRTSRVEDTEYLAAHSDSNGQHEAWNGFEKLTDSDDKLYDSD